MILQASLDSIVGPADFARVIQEAAPDRFSSTNLKAIGNRICSSWAQSGHLIGGKTRKRAHPALSPEAVAYALFLGRLTGARGPLLFSTFWTALLDAAKETLFDKATAASRRGLIELRRAGSVVDVGFSKLLTPAEQETLRESN